MIQPDLPHPVLPYRDAGGRFTAGNPGRPPGAVSRLRTQVARLLMSDFIRNHQVFMRQLRDRHAVAYMQIMLSLPEQAEPPGDPEVPEPGPIDVERLTAAGQADADIQAARSRRLDELQYNVQLAQYGDYADDEDDDEPDVSP